MLVLGELSLNEYTTAGGEKRTSLELRAREIKFGGDTPDRNAAPTAAPAASAEPAREDVEELPW